jgi:hypothetical protein
MAQKPHKGKRRKTFTIPWCALMRLVERKHTALNYVLLSLLQLYPAK